MSSQHRRPLIAFIVVASVCVALLGHAVRSDAQDRLTATGRPGGAAVHARVPATGAPAVETPAVAPSAGPDVLSSKATSGAPSTGAAVDTGEPGVDPTPRIVGSGQGATVGESTSVPGVPPTVAGDALPSGAPSAPVDDPAPSTPPSPSGDVDTTPSPWVAHATHGGPEPEDGPSSSPAAPHGSDEPGPGAAASGDAGAGPEPSDPPLDLLPTVPDADLVEEPPASLPGPGPVEEPSAPVDEPSPPAEEASGPDASEPRAQGTAIPAGGLSATEDPSPPRYDAPLIP